MKTIKLNRLQSLLPHCLVFAVLIHASAPAAANWFADNMLDPSDGKLDASKYVAEKTGVLPIPIVITEPAVGFGLGMAGVWFHDPLAGKTKPGKEFDPNPEVDGSLKTPSISALAAGYTENGTWFIGGGHHGIWRDDTIRYTAGLGKANVNMKFYGLDGGGGALGGNPINFNTEAIFLLQKLQFRIGKSKWFAGLEYIYVKTDNTFDTTELGPDTGLPNVAFSSASAGLGLILQYDGLNSPITPARGLKAELKATNYGDTWGGDNNFNKYRLFANYWLPVATDWLLGLRADGKAVTGNPAFYNYPYISLRGIPAMRYQGEEVLVGEVEARYDFTPRWSGIGFVGAGAAHSDFGQTDTDSSVVSKGVGFRYLIARRFGMRTGIDVAWGPEDTAVYIQVGNAWARP